jgi:PTH1 family peptidyl-tRNA hydrolase
LTAGSPTYLIVGLGNPGITYRNTRHNVGFKVINEVAKACRVQLRGRRFQSRHTRVLIGDGQIVLLQPLTFMNRSGQAVKAAAQAYGVSPERILIVYDDLDLPLGRIRVARNGSAGGHKGVASIIASLGTREFPRVKIGIGRPSHEVPAEDYVLSPFQREERETISSVIQLAAQACRLFVAEDIDVTMNRINAHNLADKEGET